MSKKADNFIDKYIVGKDDWLLKHKEVISKLLDEYEAEQLALHNVSQQRELLIADFIEKYNEGLVGNERIHESCLEDYLKGNL